MSAKPDVPLPDAVPIAVLSEILELSDRQCRNVLQAAGAKPSTRGRWPFVPTLTAVFQHARQAREETSFAKAKARATNAQARKIELATARAERELVSVENFNIALGFISAAVREELNGLPARLTRDRAERSRIDNEVRGALARIAQALDTKAAELENGGIDRELA